MKESDRRILANLGLLPTLRALSLAWDDAERSPRAPAVLALLFGFYFAVGAAMRAWRRDAESLPALPMWLFAAVFCLFVAAPFLYAASLPRADSKP